MSANVEGPSEANGSVISAFAVQRIAHLRATAPGAAVLFYRTNTTGAWMDTIAVPQELVATRILLDTHAKTGRRARCHRNTVVIAHDDDIPPGSYALIVMDCFHEYAATVSAVHACVARMAPDHGLLLAHDCLPWSEAVAGPTFISGSWCGQTYLGFLDVCYARPDLGFQIMDRDTGIGALSSCPGLLKGVRDLDLHAGLHAAVLERKGLEYLRAHGAAFAGVVGDLELGAKL